MASSTTSTRTLRPRVPKQPVVDAAASSSSSSSSVKRKRTTAAAATVASKPKTKKRTTKKTKSTTTSSDDDDDNDNDNERKAIAPVAARHNFSKFAIGRSVSVISSLAAIDTQLVDEYNHWFTSHHTATAAASKTRRATKVSPSSDNDGKKDKSGKEAQLGQLRRALSAAVILAQEEAGSAICVSPDGHILTCAHCVEEGVGTIREVIFADGRLFSAICTHHDATLDCALLRIQHAYQKNVSSSASVSSYPYISVPSSSHYSNGLPSSGTAVMCIGQPGRDDLEAKKARKTHYPLVNISFGELRGYALPHHDDGNPKSKSKTKKKKHATNTNNDDKDNDIRNDGTAYLDNYEIGCLMHDAWTYWGHSGAPLIHIATTDASPASPASSPAAASTTAYPASSSSLCGTLIGMHSSWDDSTAMRRGITLSAIRHFLTLCNILPSSATPAHALAVAPVAAAVSTDDDDNDE